MKDKKRNEFTSGTELRQALGKYEKLSAVYPFVDTDRIEEVLEKRNFPFERIQTIGLPQGCGMCSTKQGVHG